MGGYSHRSFGLDAMPAQMGKIGCCAIAFRRILEKPPTAAQDQVVGNGIAVSSRRLKGLCSTDVGHQQQAEKRSKSP
jgi:hypothetical protein